MWRGSFYNRNRQDKKWGFKMKGFAKVVFYIIIIFFIMNAIGSCSKKVFHHEEKKYSSLFHPETEIGISGEIGAYTDVDEDTGKPKLISESSQLDFYNSKNQKINQWYTTLLYTFDTKISRHATKLVISDYDSKIHHAKKTLLLPTDAMSQEKNKAAIKLEPIILHRVGLSNEFISKRDFNGLIYYTGYHSTMITIQNDTTGEIITLTDSTQMTEVTGRFTFDDARLIPDSWYTVTVSGDGDPQTVDLYCYGDVDPNLDNEGIR